jgi:hypothetical protein
MISSHEIRKQIPVATILFVIICNKNYVLRIFIFVRKFGNSPLHWASFRCFPHLLQSNDEIVSW